MGALLIVLWCPNSYRKCVVFLLMCVDSSDHGVAHEIFRMCVVFLSVHVGSSDHAMASQLIQLVCSVLLDTYGPF